MTDVPETLVPPAPSAARLDRLTAVVVTTALSAWNLAGSGGAAPWLAPGVVLEDPPGWPGESIWRGRAAVIERLDETTTGLGGHWAEVVGTEPQGDDVVVELRLRSSGARISVAVVTFFLVVRVRRGEIAHLRVFLDRATAAEASSRPAG